MSTTRSTLRVISPQHVLIPSPTSKHNKSFSASTTPKNHYACKDRKVNRHSSSKGLPCLQSSDVVIKKKKSQLTAAALGDREIWSPISVHVSPSSPTQRRHICPKQSNASPYQLPKHLNIPDISAIPLSPSVFECHSPAVHSPTCQHSTPSQGFLYTPDRNECCLGKGSFGNVTLCKHGSNQFALKITSLSHLSEVGEKNLLGVRHAHLVRVLSVTEILNKVFICMEFAGHCNLQYLLHHKADIDFIKRLGFAQQIAAGLNHCHQLSIVHGDVKPANVIVNPKGICKLGDFGLSIKVNSRCDKRNRKRIGITGTAAYAAPEVLKGMPISLESDMYSFAITLWQIYTRETPFAGEHPHVIIYKVVSQGTRPEFGKPTNSIAKQYMELTISLWAKVPMRRQTSHEALQHLKNLFTAAKLTCEIC